MRVEVKVLIEGIKQRVPRDGITWILADVARLYDEVLDLVESTSGVLNFNDALIALVCKERDISLIASFDADFDPVNWLRRITRPEDLIADASS